MAVFADTQLQGAGWTNGGEVHTVGYSESNEGMVIIAAAPGSGKRILLVGYFLVGEGDVGYRFQDDSNELTGLVDMAANIVHNPNVGNSGLQAAGENKPLILYQSGNIQISGWVQYLVQTKVE